MQCAARFMLALWLLAMPYFAAAQPQTAGTPPQYPAKTIRMLAGFPPGGGVDALARLFGQKFGETWGHNVIVDNRTGAGGNIATEIVAKAVPDGHTLLMAVSSLAINPSLYKIPYDTEKDLSPISLLTGRSQYHRRAPVAAGAIAARTRRARQVKAGPADLCFARQRPGVASGDGIVCPDDRYQVYPCAL